MKTIVACLLMGSLVSVLFSAEPRYIGSDKCAKMCHKGEKKGKQYEQWLGTKHAIAYKTLASDSSKLIAQKAGITGDPQQAPECLKCHVTAFGVKKELVDSTCKYEEGVGCEGCHGPGSEYRKLNIMKNKELAMKSGLIDQKETACIKCHSDNVPCHTKPFNFKESFEKVTHPIPGRVKKK